MNHRVYRKIMDNKMRVLLIPIEETDTVAVGIFIKIGSRYEDKKTSGIAHFLEHMMFKGTEHMTSQVISEKLDSVGAKYNAETSYETTHYYIYGHKNDIDLFINLMTEIYLYPLFREEDIITERGVVIEELNMVKDDPQEIIQDMFHSVLFTNSSLKYPIIGTKKNISSFTRKDLIKFRHHYYTPERTVFVVSGNIDKNAVFESIEKKFAKHIYKNYHDVILPITDPPFQSKPNIVYKANKDISQTNVMIVFRSTSMYSKYADIYDIISDVLSSGSSSRLFILLRNKLGITYFANAYNIAYAYEGAFAIHIGVDNKRVDEAIRNIFGELMNLKKKGITAEEVEKAKKIRITAFSLSLQTPQDLLNYYGLQELYYRVGQVPSDSKHKTDVKTRIQEYEAITVEEVNLTIKHLFTPENLNIIIYGSSPNKLKQLNKFEKIDI